MYKYKFEYVTGAVSLYMTGAQGDGIVAHIINDSDVEEKIRIVIYHNTGAGALTDAEYNDVNVVPHWMWGLGYTLKSSGEYWVRIQTTSQFLIPQVTFDRLQNGKWVPFISYRPGDFAMFSLLPARKKIY
jgi:hypothetical protein